MKRLQPPAISGLTSHLISVQAAACRSAVAARDDQAGAADRRGVHQAARQERRAIRRIDGGDMDAGMVLIELLDRPLHFDGELAMYLDREEQVDLGGLCGAPGQQRGCEDRSDDAISIAFDSPRSQWHPIHPTQGNPPI